MKQETLHHSYLNTIIQHSLQELYWIKIKILKLIRTSKKKEQLKSTLIKQSAISYEQEYLFSSLQDRILR